MKPGTTTANIEPQTLPDIREAYPVIDNSLFGEQGWALWAIIAVVVLLAMGLGLYLWRKRQHSAPVLSPYEQAQQDLREARNYLSMNNISNFCTVLSQGLRRYVESQTNIQAMELTTEEFRFVLQGRPLFSQEDTQALIEVLDACDRIRFAKLEPAMCELEAMHEKAQAFIENQTNEEEEAKFA